MRILHINKFLWLCGGVERYMFEVAKRCEQEGHEILYFAMADRERNVPCDQAGYFVSNIAYNEASGGYRMSKIPATIGKTVYSFESRRKLGALLNATKPDIAHLHLISHQISPSILHTLRAHNVPVVMTVHEYKLVCPSYHLYIHHKGEICERCLGGAYYNAVVQRCLKGSLGASALAAAAQYLHRATRIHEKHIDRFIAPSQFMRDKLIEGGIPDNQIVHLPYQIQIEDFEPEYDAGDYALFFGRLSPEKGILTLLKAMEFLPDRRLILAGEGPAGDAYRQYARDHHLKHVNFVGFKDGDELKQLVRDAAFVVVPSEWYDNSPLVVYESSALGKPVLGARIGGIQELIDEGQTGLLFEPGNVKELQAKMHELFDQPEQAPKLGRAGRAKIEAYCTDHYPRLMELYGAAAARHTG